MSKFRKKRYRKKFKKYKYSLSKVRNDVKMLKKGMEFKWIDVATTSDCSVAGSHTLLNGMSQGDTKATRTGDRVFSRRLMVRGYFVNSNGTPHDGVARILIYRCKQPNNADQTLALVLQSLSVNSMQHNQHASRFKIYYDNTFAFDTTAYTQIPFKIILKLKHVVVYNGNAGTYADIEKNSLYIAFISNAASDANAPDVVWNARYSFTDS